MLLQEYSSFAADNTRKAPQTIGPRKDSAATADSKSDSAGSASHGQMFTSVLHKATRRELSYRADFADRARDQIATWCMASGTFSGQSIWRRQLAFGQKRILNTLLMGSYAFLLIHMTLDDLMAYHVAIGRRVLFAKSAHNFWQSCQRERYRVLLEPRAQTKQHCFLHVRPDVR